MTPGKFLTFSFLAVILTTLVKLFFITALNIDSVYIVYLMWFLIALVSIACCRRLGVISYIEAALAMGTWLIFSLILDAVIISTIAGNGIYDHVYLWLSYVVMMVMVFLFHKKRHVAVRKLQRADRAAAKHH